MTGLSSRLSRLPLRIRLVAGFSLAMFVVLVGAGTFVYLQIEDEFDQDLDTDLANATQVLGPLIGTDGAVSDRFAAEATGVAWQVLTPDDRVLARGGAAGAESMVSAGQLAQVGSTSQTFDVGNLLPISHNPYRLRITRAAGAPARYLLVGVRRDHRDEALRELLLQLSIAGLGALVVTGFVGDRLARAALAPVERYRRQAAEIAAGSTELRLDVPVDRDDEVTRLGHTFNHMLSTLERALDRERQFANEASHELRTPITLLKSRIQLAQRRPRTVEEHERILAELHVDLDRLARLAEQLLELGSTAGASTGNSDLEDVSARVVEQRLLSGPVQFSLTVPGEPVLVAVADVELERILTNLLDNAVKHGAEPVEIRVDRPAEGWARLSVSDGGAGMPANLLAAATQRFTRADDARAKPGAGLGLSLVEALVREAGGELRLCFAGHHTSQGVSVPVPCTHGSEMTVTVLLPVG
ncbi:MAG: HAMP domain-containing protein [Nocardiaceae bacterium]|nr:HAMP domain-containing protein [Nocardiaceae bacterium]